MRTIVLASVALFASASLAWAQPGQIRRPQGGPLIEGSYIVVLKNWKVWWRAVRRTS